MGAEDDAHFSQRVGCHGVPQQTNIRKRAGPEDLPAEAVGVHALP